jgi:catechol 2,3-dioxygenase-like lactoylglutathione lyase family enzyme
VPVLQKLHLVMVPSTDHDRSIAFYESLGLEKRVDFPFGGDGRWVELFPPGGVAGIALITATSDLAGVDTGMILPVADVEAARAELERRGADVDPAVARKGSPVEITMGSVTLAEPDPPMFWLRDPDGNALLIIQG